MNTKNQGFTLAELLITIAIIGVLVAISIPIFTDQLEKSREATDLANVRSAYAEIMNAVILEDHTASHNGIPIWNEGTYSIDVPLKQKKFGWTMSKDKLVIGGISAMENTKWIDEPEPDSICSVVYEHISGFDNDEMEIHFYWNGHYYNYLPGLINGIEIAFSKTNSKVLNSNYGNTGVLSHVYNGILDEKTKNDIQTFAAVKDPDQEDTYNVIYSTFAIKDTTLRGKKIPALLYDGRTQKYTAGYATVNKAPDGNYNIITLGPNNEYVGSTKYNGYEEYKSTALITNGTTYSSRAAAQAAYNKLVKQTIQENPEYKNYLPK